MARRRYVSTEISLDEAVNDLAATYGDFAALLYTWMIPHAEDDACIRASANKLLYLVAPMRRDKSEADICDALDGMERLGLIESGWRGGVISFPADAFYRYQTYIKPEKRRDSAPNSNGSDEPDEAATNSDERRETPQNTASFSPSPSFSVSPSVSPSEDDAPADAHPVRPAPVLKNRDFPITDDVRDTAQVLSESAWINDELPAIERAVARAFSLVPDFNTRDGPSEAELFVRRNAEKPPTDWYRTLLRWFKNAVKYEQRDKAAAPHRDSRRFGSHADPRVPERPAPTPITPGVRPRLPRPA